MNFYIKTAVCISFVSLVLCGCSDRTAATAKLPEHVATVGIMVKSGQRKLKVNEKIEFPITIQNNGVAVIPADGKSDGSMKVLATYHWLRENVEVAIWDGVRTQFPEDLGKGKSVDIALALQAPPEPGRYILMLDLVQEGAQWFWDTGSQTARMLFTIEK